MKLYRIVYGSQPDFVEALDYGTAIKTWRRHKLVIWKEDGDYEPGDEHVEPESVELVHDKPVIRLMHPSEPPTAEVLGDMLALVWNEFPRALNLIRVEIENWDVKTRIEVAAWAAAVHLRASDHDVPVPPVPDVLKAVSA